MRRTGLARERGAAMLATVMLAAVLLPARPACAELFEYVLSGRLVFDGFDSLGLDGASITAVWRLDSDDLLSTQTPPGFVWAVYGGSATIRLSGTEGGELDGVHPGDQLTLALVSADDPALDDAFEARARFVFPGQPDDLEVIASIRFDGADFFPGFPPEPRAYDYDDLIDIRMDGRTLVDDEPFEVRELPEPMPGPGGAACLAALLGWAAGRGAGARRRRRCSRAR